jgi:predicted permease
VGAREEEVREEIELHLELRAEELVREEGMSPEEARREAERRFGDRDEIERRVRREAAHRDRRDDGRMTMGQVWRDVRYALRGFGRNPGFTAVAVLTLAVAVAGNTAIFSVLDEAVLQALPFPEAERLVFVDGYHDTGNGRAIRMASIPEFQDWRARVRSIEPMVAVDGLSVTLSGDGSPERVQAEAVGAGYFEMLEGEAMLGRAFTPEEAETPDGYALVVISHGLWVRRYGGDPGVVGRTVDVDEEAYTVLGVMPAGFDPVGLGGIDVWIPLGAYGEGAFASRGSRYLGVAGRLAPGFTVEEAQAELDAVARDLQAAHPDTHEDRWARVQPFREGYLGTTGDLLWVLFGAGLLLLGIASANVANLLLVRAHGRARELTVRRAMGAAGSRVVAQLLTESVVLAALGGAAGLVLAWWGIGVLVPSVPDGVLPAYVEPGISARVFLFTLGALALVGVGAGLLPAAASARRDLAPTLRSGGRGTAGPGGHRAQRIFVVVQVALALLLLVGAGLLTRSFRAQLAVDTGLEMEGIHVFRVSPPSERYPDPAALRLFADELVRRVDAVPGVDRVTASSDFPFRGRSSGSYIVRPDAPGELIRYHRHSVGPGYFATLGVTLRAGRTFTEADDEGSAGVAVVTEAMVRRVFPELPDPAAGVGRTIYVGPPSDPDNAAEIVGVVENVRYRNLTQDMMDEPNSPDVFLSLRQVPTRTHEISFRSEEELAAVLPAVREAVRAVDPDVPVFLPASLVDAYRAQTATPRFAAFLMGLFSVLALSLACVGIYGVLSFAVGQRAQEIAVRRALGARAGAVARSVVWDGVRMAVVGFLVGGGAAFLGARYLEGLLFRVDPVDPVTYAGVVGLLAAVVLAAAAVPAWRATRRDPVEALTAG